MVFESKQSIFINKATTFKGITNEIKSHLHPEIRENYSRDKITFLLQKETPQKRNKKFIGFYFRLRSREDKGEKSVEVR